MTVPSKRRPAERLQGTDGIRCDVALAREYPGQAPLAVFKKHAVITEEFMECYAYAHVRRLLKTKEARARQGFVIGWDPRDTDGTFTRAVIAGVRKAGMDALVLGVVPTPLVPMFVVQQKAAGGFMVTASHNPRGQNGIKTFLAYRGMKLLPEDDVALTRAFKKVPSLKLKAEKGRRRNYRAKALKLFREFHLDPENSWLESQSLKKITLVVDPARGSLSGLAVEVLKQSGFGRVIEVNGKLDGNVNYRSGVADLEGKRMVPSQQIEKGGAFFHHKAIQKLFELGRKNKRAIQSGKLMVSGAIFDADGDRFYRLDYHPGKDAMLVLSGDETAYLQAKFLMQQEPKRFRGTHYIHTVESDLNTALAAEKLGFVRDQSPVGDKWILLRLARMIAKARLKRVIQFCRTKDKGIKKRVERLQKQWRALEKSKRLNVSGYQKFEAELDLFQQNLDVPMDNASDLKLPFAVGSEETGHNITTGYLKDVAGASQLVFCGNGLKSALNTFAATASLFEKVSTVTRLKQLSRSFQPGYKSTLYAWHVIKEKFLRDSKLWRAAKKVVKAEAKRQGFSVKERAYFEDPDMLFLSLHSRATGREACVFLRTSGTENKVSANLRGAVADKKSLEVIGQSAVRLLLIEMKDEKSSAFKMENKLLQNMQTGPMDFSKRDASSEKILHCMMKQGLAEPSAKGWKLTDLGKWYSNEVL